MPAGASPSSGVSQTVTVQVCLRHRKPRTSEYVEEKRTLCNLRSGKSNARVYEKIALDVLYY